MLNTRCLISLLFLSLSLWGCKKKLATEGSLKFSMKVSVYDTSFVTRDITGGSIVAGAAVELNSTEYGLTYTAFSDSTGTAEFHSVIPGMYTCSANFSYDAGLVSQYIEDYNKDINLNGSLSALALKNQNDSVRLLLKPAFGSDLLISEVYYNGARKPPPYYFHDQFTEIYNNSSETVYIDGYYIGDPEYGSRPDSADLECTHLYQFPGDGDDYPIEPGQSIVVAQDAINHIEYNAQSIDLRGADFEYYNPLSNDVDAPDVTNMIQIHHKYGIDFLYSVMNAAIVLIKLDSTFQGWKYTTFNEIRVPKRFAVDGMEYRESLSEYEYKHLPDEIDAGITGGMPMYQGKSVARKILDTVDGQPVLMDTNNSSVDFIVRDTPTPGDVH